MAIIPSDEKVFMVDKRTNTIYGGSAALQAMQQWYTMQDVSDSIRPYKVFTALVTQTNGDDPSNQQAGALVIGRSYNIQDASGNPDFTIVGSPDNEVGTYFIATGITPDWGNDSATLSYNGAAPVVTVLENTIGNIWFTYAAVGTYYANSSNLFINTKTATFGGYYDADLAIGFRFNNVGYGTSSLIQLATNDGPPADSYLQNATIEIRVYN
jgi:hypothetical protein